MILNKKTEAKLFWLIKISYDYIVDLNVYKRESPITVILIIFNGHILYL